jgi:hypothetical protein
MKIKRILGAVLTLALLAATATNAFAATPKYENGFEGTLGGAKVVTREGDNENGGNTGTLPAVNDSVAAQFDKGVNGKALYLNGKYGVILDAKAVGEKYSIAFWINPARFSVFGPFVQIGSDLLSANKAAAWLNITKTDWDGESAPVIWSRNETTGAWPWYQKAYFSCGGGYQIPKNEWTHIALTVDGSKVGMDPVLGTEVADTVHSQLYINGELLGEGPVAGGIFTGDAKVYLGINCWDNLMKGLIDDIKIYDTVLTADEVKTAMNEPVKAAEVKTTETAETAKTAEESAAAEPADNAAPKTGVASFAVVFGLGAVIFGTGSVILKKKEQR